MTTLNDKFLNAYNTLDNYINRLINGKKGKNYIFLLESVLLEKESSELKTIRLFKNDIISHSVTPKFKRPQVPKEWVKFLNNLLEYCKNNEQLIKQKLLNQNCNINKKHCTHLKDKKHLKRKGNSIHSKYSKPRGRSDQSGHCNKRGHSIQENYFHYNNYLC